MEGELLLTPSTPGASVLSVQRGGRMLFGRAEAQGKTSVSRVQAELSLSPCGSMLSLINRGKASVHIRTAGQTRVLAAGEATQLESEAEVELVAPLRTVGDPIRKKVVLCTWRVPQLPRPAPSTRPPLAPTTPPAAPPPPPTLCRAEPEPPPPPVIESVGTPHGAHAAVSAAVSATLSTVLDKWSIKPRVVGVSASPALAASSSRSPGLSSTALPEPDAALVRAKLVEAKLAVASARQALRESDAPGHLSRSGGGGGGVEELLREISGVDALLRSAVEKARALVRSSTPPSTLASRSSPIGESARRGQGSAIGRRGGCGGDGGRRRQRRRGGL